MRNLTILAFLFSLNCLHTTTYCQAPTELAPGYYVVVSAYAKARENVAENYVEVLKLKGIESYYGFNSGRNQYFVYLKYFTDLKSSLRHMTNARRSEDFKNAWVRVIPGDIQLQQPVVAVQKKTLLKTEENSSQPIVATDQTTPSINPAPTTPANNEVDVTDNEEIVQHQRMTLGNTEVFLSLFNSRNNRIVDGEVQVVDADRARQITKVKGNEYLVLPDPKSKSGQLILICEAFGYRKVQQELNYPLPLADTVKPNIDLMGTTLVINFDLVRYHLGDFVTLNNVYFYNDAAIMLPESSLELNSLLQLMNENPKYKIKLHGHSNGNYHGKIVTLGPDKNFFSLTGAKESIGSAKDLSANRALVIKEFLIANGVTTDRVETKAWGGKRPLYDKLSVNAKKNVRVEVEIMGE